MDTGGTGFDWQRRATVSLSGKFGELRMGRDRNPIYPDRNARDIWGYAGVATTATLRGNFLTLGGATTGVRTGDCTCRVRQARPRRPARCSTTCRR